MTDWCMSPHCIAPESKFTKLGEEMSIGQTPNHAKFCGDPLSKICAPWKSGPKFTKIFKGMLLTKATNQPKFCRNRLEKVGQNSPKSLKTCYLLKPPPLSCQISSRSVQPPWRRTLQKFYTLQNFGSSWTPWARGHRSGWWGTSTAPSSYNCKISSRSEDSSPRYLLRNIVDFVAGVTHKNIKPQTCSKRYVSAFHATTITKHNYKEHCGISTTCIWLIALIIGNLTCRGVYPRGVGRAISHIFKNGGWPIGHFN